VTTAILDRMRADGTGCVWLDMREVDGARFPNVVATLAQAGIDPAREPVPVAPAAHYLVGGVATDLDGRTNVAGLLAVGECACTGLHGANRLASNSLSECFVFGARAAAAAVSARRGAAEVPLPAQRFVPPSVETRRALWRHAGPQRDADRLERLLDDAYPLARMIAASALARRESRGVHRRTDVPNLDPGLDGVHFVCPPQGGVGHERWA
jgi:L-aspartate oxidase